MEKYPPEPLDQGEITKILSQWQGGDHEALNRLFPLVYENLRSTAKNFLHRESNGHTLQPTAIINEVYIQLSGNQKLHFPSLAQFFAFAAKVIRNILTAHARNHQAQKRGGGKVLLCLNENLSSALNPNLEMSTLVSLDQALNELATLDPRQSQVVELRFFAGFQIDELSDFFHLPPATIKRELTMAKRWLARRLKEDAK